MVGWLVGESCLSVSVRIAARSARTCWYGAPVVSKYICGARKNIVAAGAENIGDGVGTLYPAKSWARADAPTSL